MYELLKQPWPWYVAGPLIGLMVPLLLIIGNKPFGISSSLKHICAICLPSKIPFFNYDWKKETWNLVFVAGILLGGFFAAIWLSDDQPITINPKLANELAQYGITDYSSLSPSQLFNFSELLSLKGFILIIVGGFLVGFGTRYANGCTSGHSIMGLSNLQFSSLVATICFMAGGIFMANLILPLILKL
ncbi:MAG: YeeE/YedE family protein [Chitinophagaceae bacterium]|nr:YeeE/YedE family protein [Chitinophagaceae bacterium]